MKRNDLTPRRLAALTALLALCALTAIATAQPAAPGGAGDAAGAVAERGDHGLARLARDLGLNDGQRDAIAKIETAGRARDLPLRKELRRLRHELRGEMMKDAPAGKTVAGLAGQIGDVRTKLQTGRLLDRLAVRQVLTPEQRDQLLMMGERGDGPGGGRHRGHRGPFGPGGDDAARPGRGGRFPGCPGPEGPDGAGRRPGNGD